MKRTSTLFLRVVIGLVAIATLAGLIRFPQTEGRAAHMDLISIYEDPFILYIYIASIPFFVALYQGFKLLGLIEQKKIFSKNAVNALRNIRNCALLIIGFLVGAAAFIRLTVDLKNDDPAGFIALCIFTSVASAAVAAVSSLFAKLLQERLKK